MIRAEARPGRVAVMAIALALACTAAGGGALTPAAEPGFRRFARAVNEGRALGDAARVESVAIEPIDARVSLTVDGAPVIVRLVDRDAGGPGLATRWFLARVDPPGALGPAREAAIARALDDAFAESPFVGAGLADGARSARSDRPRTLDDAVRLELARTPPDATFVSRGALFSAIAVVAIALAASLAVVLGRARR